MKQSTQRDERQSFQLDPKEHFKERVMIRGLFTAGIGHDCRAVDGGHHRQ
jgi:hypothetical protein